MPYIRHAGLTNVEIAISPDVLGQPISFSVGPIVGSSRSRHPSQMSSSISRRELSDQGERAG
jgi:hypothetical protein